MKTPKAAIAAEDLPDTDEHIFARMENKICPSLSAVSVVSFFNRRIIP